MESIKDMTTSPHSLGLKFLQSPNDCDLLISDDGLRLSSDDIEEIHEQSLEILLGFWVHEANPEGYGLIVIVFAKQQS